MFRMEQRDEQYQYFEGQYKKGQKDGFGTLRLDDRTYEGEFSANKLHGIGTYVDSKGYTYVG